MDKNKVSLGDRIKISDYGQGSDEAGEGSFIELNRPGHHGAGVLVWRMQGEKSSPQQEEFCNFVIKACNAYDNHIDFLFGSLKRPMYSLPGVAMTEVLGLLRKSGFTDEEILNRLVSGE